MHHVSRRHELYAEEVNSLSRLVYTRIHTQTNKQIKPQMHSQQQAKKKKKSTYNECYQLPAIKCNINLWSKSECKQRDYYTHV